MKPLIRFFVLCGIAVSGMLASAVCYSDNLKIGVLDFQVLQKAPQFLEVQARLKKEFEPRAKKLEADEKALKSKLERLQRDKDILSEKERLAQEREVTRLRQNFQHLAETFDADQQSRNQEELMAFNKIVERAVNQVAKSENYDLILPGNLTMFNNGKSDFTSKVLKVLEKESKTASKK